MISKVKILNMFDAKAFEKELTQYLSEGWDLESSSVGVDGTSDKYQALLIKNGKKTYSYPPEYKIGTKVMLHPDSSITPGSCAGEIIGYQVRSVDFRTDPGTKECEYVIKYFEKECDTEYTFVFTKDQFNAVE